jgi:hypothetical protein
MSPLWRRTVRHLLKAQDECAGRDYSCFDLAIAILFGIAIAAWLVAYAVLLVWYGHDRTYRTATSSDSCVLGDARDVREQERRVTLQMSLCGFLRTRQTDRKLSLITDQERGARLGLPVATLRFVAM